MHRTDKNWRQEGHERCTLRAQVGCVCVSLSIAQTDSFMLGDKFMNSLFVGALSLFQDVCPSWVRHRVFLHNSCTTVFISAEDDVSWTQGGRFDCTDSGEDESPSGTGCCGFFVVSWQPQQTLWAHFNNSLQQLALLWWTHAKSKVMMSH